MFSDWMKSSWRPLHVHRVAVVLDVADGLLPAAYAPGASAEGREVRADFRALVDRGQEGAAIVPCAALAGGIDGDAVPPEDVLSINDPQQLSEVDAILRQRLAASRSRSSAEVLR